jgi:hypothetical protein
MYIEQKYINDSYTVGTDTFEKAVLSQLYCDINALIFEDNDISDKVLLLLYAVNSIDVRKGDDDNLLGRNDMLALLTTIAKQYEAKYNFHKPVTNRRNTCLLVVSKDDVPARTTEQFDTVSFTTDGIVTNPQFIQSLGLDRDFSASNELAQISSDIELNPTGFITVFDLLTSTTAALIQAQVAAMISALSFQTLYYTVPVTSTVVTIPQLVGHSIKLILRGGIGTGAIILTGTPVGAEIKSTPSTGDLESSVSNEFAATEILTIQYV